MTMTNKNHESKQLIKRSDLPKSPKRRRKKVDSCVTFLVQRKGHHYHTRNNTMDSTHSSYSDYDFLSDGSNQARKKRTRSVPAKARRRRNKENLLFLEILSSMSKKRKYLRLTNYPWNFEGEPVPKRTRSGCVYGYINLVP